MRIIAGILFLLLCQSSFGQEDRDISMQVKTEELPIPNEREQLFYLQRDPDSNTVIYALNLEDGKINEENPVSAYWIRYAEEGQKEDLSFIQRTMAFGIQHKMVAPGIFELRVQAYKPLTITLSPDAKTGKYQTTVQVMNEKVILNRIFVRINGGSFFKPNVEYIEISGSSDKDGKKIKHRFIP